MIFILFIIAWLVIGFACATILTIFEVKRLDLTNVTDQLRNEFWWLTLGGGLSFLFMVLIFIIEGIARLDFSGFPNPKNGLRQIPDLVVGAFIRRKK